MLLSLPHRTIQLAGVYFKQQHKKIIYFPSYMVLQYHALCRLHFRFICTVGKNSVKISYVLSLDEFFKLSVRIGSTIKESIDVKV